MASRGIMDQATQVKLAQDQRAAQAAQFDKTFEEGQRRFDATMAANAENTAWTRSQAESKAAEERRRFDLGQQTAADNTAWARSQDEKTNARAERGLALQEFNSRLNSFVAEANLANLDIKSRQSAAQLKQYLAATDEEARQRDNRDRVAKGAFGSLVIAGKLNGGVMPSSAIAIANKELGDKDNFITGGGFDEGSGQAWFDVRDRDGNVKRLNMTPENQYMAIHSGLGKEAADMFYGTFSANSAARVGIERRRMELEGKQQIELAKSQNPSAQADALDKAAASYQRQATTATDPVLRKKYQDAAASALDESLKLRKSIIYGGQDQSAQTPAFTVTADMAKKYGIEPGYRVSTDPKTGETKVTWRKGGEVLTKTFRAGDNTALEDGK